MGEDKIRLVKGFTDNEFVHEMLDVDLCNYPDCQKVWISWDGIRYIFGVDIEDGISLISKGRSAKGAEQHMVAFTKRAMWYELR